MTKDDYEQMMRDSEALIETHRKFGEALPRLREEATIEQRLNLLEFQLHSMMMNMIQAAKSLVMQSYLEASREARADLEARRTRELRELMAMVQLFSDLKKVGSA
jgi:hypothetical protein